MWSSPGNGTGELRITVGRNCPVLAEDVIGNPKMSMATDASGPVAEKC